MDRSVGERRVRLGLTTSGRTFSLGLQRRSKRPRITINDLIDQAIEAQLEGVEFPAGLLASDDPSAVGAYARERDVFVNLATSGYEPDGLAATLDLASRIGAEAVRTVVGGAHLGGDRRPLQGAWAAFLQRVLAGLREATRAAEGVGVNLAVENHQDLASEELLWLCETIDSPRFGITLDAANPLATAEEPLDFTRRVAPFVKNVHLKDYWIYLSEDGFRLVRCPLGQGITDFAAIIKILADAGVDAPMSVELAALEARHVRVLRHDYWCEYPQRSATQLAEALRVVHAEARVAGEWRTPFERDASVDEICDYEERQLAESLAYVRGLRTLVETGGRR